MGVHVGSRGDITWASILVALGTWASMLVALGTQVSICNKGDTWSKLVTMGVNCPT